MMPSRTSGCSSKTKIRVLTDLFPFGDMRALYGSPGFCHFGASYVKPGIASGETRIAHRVLSFQKQVHALEIDDGMTNVQRIHAQNAAGLCAALSQREMGQRDDAKLLARHHKIANLQITDARGTDMLRCASGKIS